MEGILITIAVGFVGFLLQDIYRTKKELKKTKVELVKANEQCELKLDQAVRNGLACVLRMYLMDFHDKYMKKKYITIHAKEIYEKMYESYHDLGGNGLIDDMHEDINELEIRRT